MSGNTILVAPSEISLLIWSIRAHGAQKASCEGPCACQKLIVGQNVFFVQVSYLVQPHGSLQRVLKEALRELCRVGHVCIDHWNWRTPGWHVGRTLGWSLTEGPKGHIGSCAQKKEEGGTSCWLPYVGHSQLMLALHCLPHLGHEIGCPKDFAEGNQ
jgi:hypothetical protein